MVVVQGIDGRLAIALGQLSNAFESSHQVEHSNESIVAGTWFHRKFPSISDGVNKNKKIENKDQLPIDWLGGWILQNF